ncbi:retroviral integration site protein Fli-1 homolog [Alligator sinensis]|uniref:Retroviral integration site protein Fli-1 homolog n=1 Tax=Alligator sinensis TaxID=38654 RepID=A0A3Q0HP09_ALLSI|nr:retroviral integration site protein Fli-1 homolog [Alligator sinensis]
MTPGLPRWGGWQRGANTLNPPAPEPTYDDSVESSWTGTSPRDSPPPIQVETTHIVPDPYQVLGPTSSRLANPGSGQIQ